MADSSEIDAALVNKLLNDAQLRALMPDGVFFDLAGPSIATGKNSTRFVLVSLVDENDRAVFQRRGFEDALYLIRAVALQGAGDVKTAAARIDTLLEDQPLTVAGYTWMTTHRESRVRTMEEDSVDISIKWAHRGGMYRVQMSI